MDNSDRRYTVGELYSTKKSWRIEARRMQPGAHGNLMLILPGNQSRKKRNVPSKPAKVCPPISAGDQGFAH
jgi:hypothetical protein